MAVGTVVLGLFELIVSEVCDQVKESISWPETREKERGAGWITIILFEAM